MAVLLCTVICVVLVWWFMKPKDKGPPIYPWAFPLVGHLPHLFGDRTYLARFLKTLNSYCVEKGDVIRMWFGTHTFYIVTDPDDSILIANTCLNKSYFYDFAKNFLGTGLITADASLWKAHRKLLNPAFNQQVLNTFLDEINGQARSLVALLDTEADKKLIDVRSHFVNFTLKTVSRTSLGLDVKDQNVIDTDYAEAFEEYVATLVERVQSGWMHLSYAFNFSALKRKQEALIKKMKNIIDPIIVKRKSDLKMINRSNADNNNTIPDRFKPVLDQMLNLAEEQNAFTNEDIRAHLDTFVAASYDTSSSAMTFMLVVIGSNEDIQEKIYKELEREHVNKDEDITKDVLPKLVYLEAVVKETLRLYSPVPVILRKLDKNVRIKNYTLEAGNTCVIGLQGINNHTMWGPDVDQFKPERWLDPATLPKNPNAFMAFGAGRRNCIGKLYSMMVIKTTLAHILRRYRVSSDISKLQAEFDVVLKPIAGHLIGLTLRN
nr:cytochrome P450 4V2-like [Helicoverpa armigera]